MANLKLQKCQFVCSWLNLYLYYTNLQKRFGKPSCLFCCARSKHALLVYVLLEVFETFQNNIHNSMYLRSNVVLLLVTLSYQFEINSTKVELIYQNGVADVK